MDLSRPGRRRRRRWFAAAGVLLVLLVVEGASLIVYWLLRGEGFSYARVDAARAAAQAGDLAGPAAEDPAQAEAQRLLRHDGVVHPYLGFVYDPTLAPTANTSRWGISDYGFVDTAPPIRKRATDRYIVGIVGGSVALQLSLHAEAVLIAELQRSPHLRGRTVELVRLALGGYKQPQQVLSLLLCLQLGGEFDCVVNVDGFNDVVLPPENLAVGVPGWFPRGWARLAEPLPSREQQRQVGRLVLLREQRAAMAASAETLAFSPTAQLIWWWRDRALARRIADLAAAIERAAASPAYAVTGPGRPDGTPAEMLERMAAVWRRGSENLQALCAQHGIDYFHFLQPNQYVPDSKPIGEVERAIAVLPDHPWAAAVVAGYPLLQAEAPALHRAGVRFTDLTMLLRAHPEPLYVDTCCHLSRTGYEILASHIAAVVRRHLDLDGVRLVGLRVGPPELDLDSPLAVERLAVFGIDAEGREHDVTAAGFGTTMVGADSLLEVGSDGAVRAKRRGSATLVVRHGELSVPVPVRAHWPDRIVAADGLHRAGGAVPQLEVEAPAGPGPVRASVRCSGLPAAGHRLLVVSLVPIPASVPQNALSTLGMTTSLLDAGGADAAAEVPIDLVADQPVFLRVVVLAEDAASVAAASCTVVLTR